MYIRRPWAQFIFLSNTYVYQLTAIPNTSDGLGPNLFVSNWPLAHLSFVHVELAFGPFILFMSNWPLAHSYFYVKLAFGPFILSFRSYWPLAHSFIHVKLILASGPFIFSFMSDWPLAQSYFHVKHLSTIRINKLIRLTWK